MALAIENRFGNVKKLVDTAQIKSLDPEIASYYCKLGCVMICGAVERSVELLIIDRIGGRSAPQVSAFLKSYFKRGTNYDCESIMDLLYKFDTKWGHGFKAFVDENDMIKTGISSCYAIRNSIAHGGSSSLGPRTLLQYYEAAAGLVAELENILHGK